MIYDFDEYDEFVQFDELDEYDAPTRTPPLPPHLLLETLPLSTMAESTESKFFLSHIPPFTLSI